MNTSHFFLYCSLMPGQGNVEYKLQLLNPSPARFARLVTQLKWRLLEGGGQAYYELGVADSGALIGLPRAELELSLETLEMMAGEIGASVIVVKEIEVPAVMAEMGMAKQGVAIAAGAVGFQREARSPRPRYSDIGLCKSVNESRSSSSCTETEFDAASTEDEVQFGSSSTDSLNADEFGIDLEIATVYKPRPMRRRANHDLEATGKRKGKKYHLFTTQLAVNLDSAAESLHCALPSEIEARTNQASVLTKQQSKSENRRLGRDRKREERRKSFTHDCDKELKMEQAVPRRASSLEQDVEDLTSSLATLHASSGILPVPTISLDVGPTEGISATDATPTTMIVDSVTATTTKTPGSMTLEPRLIVETLVVRKLSLEEAYLDFGNFSVVA